MTWREGWDFLVDMIARNAGDDEKNYDDDGAWLCMQLSFKKRGMHELPALLSDGVLASGIAPSWEYVVGGEVHDRASKVQWMAEGDRCA